MSEGALQTLEGQGGMPMTVQNVKDRLTLVHQVMDEVMKPGVHYGIISGTPKPTLLQPGAQILNLTFGMAPEFRIETHDLGNGHREIISFCDLFTIEGHKFLGSGVGSCSTMEKKYRYRQGERICPKCGKAAIIKGKEEYGGGWLCFGKKGGCGAKFDENAQEIISQNVGQIENPDIADVWNTVRKISAKRAEVHATINVTATSDVWSQDLEDMDPEQIAGMTIGGSSAPAAPKNTPGKDAGNDMVKAGALMKELKFTEDEIKKFVATVSSKQRTAAQLLAWLQSEKDKRAAAPAKPGEKFSEFKDKLELSQTRDEVKALENEIVAAKLNDAETKQLFSLVLAAYDRLKPAAAKS